MSSNTINVFLFEQTNVLNSILCSVVYMIDYAAVVLYLQSSL